MLAVDGVDLHPEVIQLASGPNFAAVTTLLPDGHPQTQITWIDVDGQHLIVNTPATSQKARNARRDRRITVVIWNKANPYQYAEVRGEVTEFRGAVDAAEHVHRLSRAYGGEDYPRPDGRIMLVITPRRQLLARPPLSSR